MRMIQSEAKVPPRDVGPSNKHGPPVWPPPILGLRIRGKPRTREPVVGRVPARNKAPTSHLKLVLVIRPPSLLWEKYVRPPTESPPAHRIETGNNYWETGTAPGKSPPTHPGTGHPDAARERYGKRDANTKARGHDNTRVRLNAKTLRHEEENLLCGTL